MARSRVHNAGDAVIEAAVAYRAIELAWQADRCADLFGQCEKRANLLRAAVDEYNAAVASQRLDDNEVYLRNGATQPERQAAAAAMKNRPGMRRMIWQLLRYFQTTQGIGLSDRQIEIHVRLKAGQRLYELNVPPGGISHQSLSSARKSLVDAGLVYQDGYEIHEGRKHSLWRAREVENIK